MYIWQLPDWPNFRFDEKALALRLAEVRHAQGRLLGRMEGMGLAQRDEASLRVLTEDVIKSSEIEGEHLNRESVRSSLARQLGIDIGALAPADRNVDGVVAMVLDAPSRFDQPLTRERLFGWQAALFPTRRSGMANIRIGAWRDDASGPMQVVSGPINRQKVHYQAPPAERLDAGMNDFLRWFDEAQSAGQAMDPVLKAGLAHLWFVTLHPFEDGNGRIARAIGDMGLARAERNAQRFYSLSSQIRLERKDYYALLESSMKTSLDATAWLEWFLNCLHRAIDGAQETLSAVLLKARFWEQRAGMAFNERQIKVLNRMLDGFEGKLTSSKWAAIAKCSPDTALRDITDLLGRGVLRKSESGGRSTSYEVAG